MLMNWGQVLGNEITYPAAIFKSINGAPCCSQPLSQSKFDDCAEITIPHNDALYTPYNVSCLNFIRSPPCLRCDVQVRTPLNLHTTPIDASTIYGNCLKDANELREFKAGLLKDSSSRFLMNLGFEEENDCGDYHKKFYPHDKTPCFKSGDSYVNNNPFKTALVTSLFREHNRLASRLSQINPNWDDERLFQESRKIIGAVMEVITYKEFLPSILSPDIMEAYQLNLLSGPYYTEYNALINPATSVEFTSSVMRSIGHSMISSNTTLSFFNGTTVLYPLKETFFWVRALEDGYIDALNRGSLTQAINIPDIYIDDVARNFMMKVHSSYGPEYGWDIASLDINRGRDHGVASYVTFRSLCQPSFDVTSVSFEAFASESVMSVTNANKLSQVYESPEDVDLYTGILMENPLPGSLIGSTGNCLWGREFYAHKFGDRYYFEHGRQSGSFTAQQLMALKQVTLSKIICENGDEYPNEKIQARSMFLPNPETNPLVDCSSLPDLDLSPWTESITSGPIMAPFSGPLRPPMQPMQGPPLSPPFIFPNIFAFN
jgi:peroxidase